jgi:3-oxoacyl-[acyl-carrier protein] reductase
MSRLAGRRAVVTGAASGIGRATAVRFAAEGARVAVLDRDADGAAAVAREIGPAALAVAADITVEDDVERTVAEAEAAFGGLDTLVANAAVQLFGQDARATDLDLAVWERTIRVNLTGTFLTCKHGIRALLRAGGGSVVCTASPTGLYGVAPGFDAYSSSKGGVSALVRVLARDFGAEGVRVNAVVPGFTDTPLVTDLVTDERERGALLAGVPLGRPGRPEEVAAMMCFLASDEAAYCTGGSFPVDGGMTAV